MRAQNYRTFEHHLALTNLASLVAQTKFQWAQESPRDPTLLQQFQNDALPVLSVANIRQLFLNRIRSRKSRLRKQQFLQNSFLDLSGE